MNHIQDMLECAYTHWLLGEWDELIQLESQVITDGFYNKDIDLFFLAAHLQTLSKRKNKDAILHDAKNKLEELIAQGISRRKIGMIVLSGVQNSLARAHCVNNQLDMAKLHFGDALGIYQGSAPSPTLLSIRTESQIKQLEEYGANVERIKSLRRLYEGHDGHVSDKWSLYLDVYNDLFSYLRHMPISLLEIGVQNGGSLEIWSKFFPKYEKIVGCDINPACAKINYKKDNIDVVIGDANCKHVKESIQDLSPKFDIVIEDGSHKSSDIVKSFFNYFPVIKNGGFFVAEDLHCSYWERFEGGLGYKKSSIEFFKLLVDVLNYEHWVTDIDRYGYLKEFCRAEQFDESFLNDIHSIQFFNSICVVKKKNVKSNSLGFRYISGVNEFVHNLKKFK